MRAFLLLAVAALSAGHTSACTLFKITQGGKTMVGNNEDAWGLYPWIRFEQARAGRHGVAYVGHRDGLPQGGMNDAGLVFDGFSVPVKEMHAQAGRTLVPGTFAFLGRIMHECASVEEVRALLSRYDWTSMRQGMILFVDRAGNYLVMEGDTVFTGDDPTYVVGNFRPSQCMDLDSVAIPRFQQGRAYLAAHGDTGLRSCTAMMEAMKACRRKLGEGTLYTNIFDLQQGLVHLYFYHDFMHVRTFDLKAELAKGDHTLMMTALFGPNAEYTRLVRYKTPFNNAGMRRLLLGCALLVASSGLFGTIAVVRALLGGKEGRKRALVWAAATVTSGLALVLIALLFWEQGIYYFGIANALHGMSVPGLPYVPLLVLTLTLLLVWIVFVRRRMRTAGRWMLTVNVSVCLALSGLCAYWGILVP